MLALLINNQVSNEIAVTWSADDDHPPASLGRARQLSWPYCCMWETKIWSSSGVHDPFFNPIFSQQGVLTILIDAFLSSSFIPSWKA